MGWKPAEGEQFPSLGWLIADWIEENLVVPDGIRAGQPLVLSDDQLQFLVRLMRIRPEVDFQDGMELAELQQQAFVYSSGCYSRPKGTGKSPFCAALAWAFALGPVIFDGWDEDGQPMGRPHPSPWIQVLGVSSDNTINLWSALLASAELENNSPLQRNYPGLDIGRTRIYVPGGKLEFVTSEAGTREGQRVTFAVVEESGYLTKANKGVEVANTVRRNVAKMGGVSVEVTNAFVVGQESLAEGSYETDKAWREGNLKTRPPLLYDHREAPLDTDVTDRDSLEKGLRFAYGDVPWVSIDRLITEFWDPRNPIENSRRFYLNQISAAIDAWLIEAEVEQATRPFDLKPGDMITLGFDGSLGRKQGVADATALVACRLRDSLLTPIPWKSGWSIWEEPKDGATKEMKRQGKKWEVPVGDVEACVKHAMETYNVIGFYADPAKWSESVAVWNGTYGPKMKVKATSQRPISWSMSGLRSRAVHNAIEALRMAFEMGDVRVSPNTQFHGHLLNARKRYQTLGYRIYKEHPQSENKIDSAIAAILAFQARTDAIAAGLAVEPPKRYARKLR